jgi:hypothetical protein
VQYGSGLMIEGFCSVSLSFNSFPPSRRGNPYPVVDKLPTLVCSFVGSRTIVVARSQLYFR